MSFTSVHFYIFLLLLLVCLHVIKSNPAKKSLLLLASYLFYMTWDWRLGGLLFLVSIVNFACGHKISADANNRKLWLVVSVTFSLTILGVFKYLNFFIENINSVADVLGLSSHLPILEILLPVGISFYTFQALSYTIDIYRGELKPAKSLTDFLLFNSFFPILLAGPITRAKFFLPQLEKDHRPTDVEKNEAVFLIMKGLAKKIILADVLATQIVNPAFSAPEHMSSLFLVIAVIAYSFQIYLDFSAYTDMARGVAKLIGYELPKNFDRPYLAHSVSNFWQRWHISMSSFFRDYLFISLGGSRTGNVYFNLMVTFIAIGLWHGAGMTFVVYGLAHGLIVCFERMGRNKGYFHRGTGSMLWLAILRTFLIVAFLRIIFRVDEMSDSINFVKAMISNEFYANELSLISGLALLLSVLLHVIPVRAIDSAKSYFIGMPSILKAVAMVSLIYLLIPFGSNTAPFIYFQF